MGKLSYAAEFVSPIFKENNWEYLDGVPEIEELKETLRGLKKSAKECKGWAISGRLAAIYDHDSKKVEYLLCIPYKKGD